MGKIIRKYKSKKLCTLSLAVTLSSASLNCFLSGAGQQSVTTGLSSSSSISLPLLQPLLLTHTSSFSSSMVSISSATSFPLQSPSSLPYQESGLLKSEPLYQLDADSSVLSVSTSEVLRVARCLAKCLACFFADFSLALISRQ